MTPCCNDKLICDFDGANVRCKACDQPVRQGHISLPVLFGLWAATMVAIILFAITDSVR